MTLHVVQLGPYPPPHGGVSRNLLAIRDAVLAGGGRSSIIATTKGDDRGTDADVYYPSSAAGLCRILRQLDADVVHLHIGGNVNNRVMALALAVASLSKRSVLTMHSGAFPLSKHSLSASPSSIRGRIFRRFDRVIAVNDAIANVFARYGVDGSRLSIIPPHSLKLPNERVELAKKHKDFLERHSPVLLAVGGLESDYDPLFQIRALKEILLDHPRAGLIIVGDGSMRREVESAANDSGYAENILLTGNIPNEQTLHLIAGADILLRTTLFDGDAISVREALHLGTPVIATDNGMRPSGVRIIRNGDVESLRSEIKSALTAPAAVAATSADNSNIEAVLDVYRELAA